MSSTLLDNASTDCGASTTNSANQRKRPALSRVAIMGSKGLSASSDSINSNASIGVSGALHSSDDEQTQDGQVYSGSREWSDSESGDSKRLRTTSSESLVSDRAESQTIFDLADLECSQGTSASSTRSLLSSGGLLLEDGRYELVGDGRECKAVDLRTSTVHHCLIMRTKEYKATLDLLARLEEARLSFASKIDDFDELKNRIVPDNLKLILHKGLWYALLPDHYGNLHNLAVPPISSTCDFSTMGNASPMDDFVGFTEARVQPIFRQIVEMMQFCHRAGIYFKDMRMKKFVFTDEGMMQIRLNSPLDVSVSPTMDTVLIEPQLKPMGIPRFATPEYLAGKEYDGKASDVWALGVLFFLLLMGKWPFYELNSAPGVPYFRALFRQIRARHFSNPVSERVSPNARWLLHALLRLNPLDRPTPGEILAFHWTSFTTEQLPDGRETSKKRQPTSLTSLTSSRARREAPAFVSATRDHDYAVQMRTNLPLQRADTTLSDGSRFSSSLSLARADSIRSVNRVASARLTSQTQPTDQIVPS